MLRSYQLFSRCNSCGVAAADVVPGVSLSTTKLLLLMMPTPTPAPLVLLLTAGFDAARAGGSRPSVIPLLLRAGAVFLFRSEFFVALRCALRSFESSIIRSCKSPHGSKRSAVQHAAMRSSKRMAAVADTRRIRATGNCCSATGASGGGAEGGADPLMVCVLLRRARARSEWCRRRGPRLSVLAGPRTTFGGQKTSEVLNGDVTDFDARKKRQTFPSLCAHPPTEFVALQKHVADTAVPILMRVFCCALDARVCVHAIGTD